MKPCAFKGRLFLWYLVITMWKQVGMSRNENFCTFAKIYLPPYYIWYNLLSMCMCVCACACVWCVCVIACVTQPVYISVCMHVSMHACNVCIHTRHVCMFLCACVHTLCVCECVCACVCVRAYVRACVRACVFVCLPVICVCMHTSHQSCQGVNC